MLNHARHLPIALAVVVFAALSLPANGQASSPNNDIVRLIQAGLPEGVILTKIHQGTGHWDTSADALIALKQAGATDEELRAMTNIVAAPPVAAAAPGPQKVDLMGGTLINDHGHVTIRLPYKPGDYSAGLRFDLVLVDNKPALKLQIESIKQGFTTFQCRATRGDLVITQETTTFYPLGMSGAGCNRSKFTLVDKPDTIQYSTSKIELHESAINYKPVKFSNAGTFKDLFVLENETMFYEYRKKDSSPSSQFLSNAFSNFAGTVSSVLQAAGITDPAAQLPADVRFQPPTKEFAQARVDSWNKMADQDRAGKGHQGGGFLNGVVGAMAVVSSGANVLQAAQSGNVAAEINAQQAYAQTVAQAVNGDSAGAATTAQAAAAATPPPAQPFAPVPAPAAQPGARSTTKSYTVPLNGGGTRKETIVTDASGSHITVQCFAPGAAVPYESFTRSGPSEFFTNLPACSRAASTSAGNGYGTGTAKPPVPANPAPAPVQPTTVAANSNVCPPGGWIMIQNGDVAVGQQCTPGQPIGSTTSYSGSGSSGSTSGSGGSGASSGGGSASGGGQYVPSLPISCISMDFNGNYDWDQYYNHCNQDISVTFVFQSGLQGTMDPIRAGGASGTGHSQAEYQSNGGEPSLYICPAGDIPVTAQGTMVNRMGMQYRCKLP